MVVLPIPFPAVNNSALSDRTAGERIVVQRSIVISDRSYSYRVLNLSNKSRSLHSLEGSDLSRLVRDLNYWTDPVVSRVSRHLELCQSSSEIYSYLSSAPRPLAYVRNKPNRFLESVTVTGMFSGKVTHRILSQSFVRHAASTSPSSPQIGQRNTWSMGMPSSARNTAFRFFLIGRDSADPSSAGSVFWPDSAETCALGIASTNMRSSLQVVLSRRAKFRSVFLFAHMIHRRSSPSVNPEEPSRLDAISASSDCKQSVHWQKTAAGMVLSWTEGRSCTTEGDTFADSSSHGCCSRGTGRDGADRGPATSVACLMLARGFLSCDLSEDSLVEFCGWVEAGVLGFAVFNLCRGRGATKISVSGLTRTAVLGFVGGLVSSAIIRGVLFRQISRISPRNKYIPTTRLIFVFPLTHTLIVRSPFELAARS